MASKLIAKEGPASGVSYTLEQQEIFISLFELLLN